LERLGQLSAVEAEMIAIGTHQSDYIGTARDLLEGALLQSGQVARWDKLVSGGLGQVLAPRQTRLT
jgi:hypothetical protein